MQLILQVTQIRLDRFSSQAKTFVNNTLSAPRCTAATGKDDQPRHGQNALEWWHHFIERWVDWTVTSCNWGLHEMHQSQRKSDWMEEVIANIMSLWQSPPIHSVGNFQLCFLRGGGRKKESTHIKVHSISGLTSKWKSYNVKDEKILIGNFHQGPSIKEALIWQSERNHSKNKQYII